MRITIYCPDENFRLRGNLLKEVGIGGGKTAILSLARAFSILGHQVSVCGYVEEGRFDGVEYMSQQRVDGIKTDILIATTSHKMELFGMRERNIDASLMFLWLHGIGPIKGMEEFQWDGVICVSNFIKNNFVNRSKIPKEKFFVIHNGIDKGSFKPYYRLIKRDPYGIVFASHPVKGLDKVIRIVDTLRKDISPHFHLDVFGGNKLWGEDQPEMHISSEGISYKGIIPQPQLMRKLFSYNFMINLYDLPEGFGLIYPQALRAGIISIVSNVGGVSEIIRDGYNGFLVNKPCEDKSIPDDVKNTISYLIRNKRFLSHMRNNALKYNRGWDEVAVDFMNLFGSKTIIRSPHLPTWH